MRILTVSDEESSYYYDHYVPGRLEGFDLILSCGDLRREYLEFLSTLAGCPVVYVRGNHDDRLENAPPEGCLCAEDKIVVCHGLRILGLGGSHRYRPGKNMYTEAQMRRPPTPPPGRSTTWRTSLTVASNALWTCWTDMLHGTLSTDTSI